MQIHTSDGFMEWYADAVLPIEDLAKQFLDHVVPTEGYLALVKITRDKNNKSKAQTFYVPADEVQDAQGERRKLLNIDLYEDMWFGDLYFTPATFKSRDRPKSVQNVLQLKSFFLNIDCGKGQIYANQLDALYALYRFCELSSLPIPTITNSGNGLHAYWVLTQAINYDTWYPIAVAFRDYVHDKCLAADKVVTTDAARMLRLPGTLNNKLNSDPKPVVIIGYSEPIELSLFCERIGYSAE